MRISFSFSLLLIAPSLSLANEENQDKLCHTSDHYDDHPILCNMLDRLYEDSESLADELTHWASEQGLLVGERFDFSPSTTRQQHILEGAVSSEQLPIVFAHGMGDSCFNSGFQNLVKHTSSILNDVYSVCIPTGKTQKDDTTNGYFLNMDASVDVFAESIKADPRLKDGFHAIGLSQGNNVIRGYITRYNEPAVDSFISINGVNGGTGALPNCFPNGKRLGGICSLLTEQASRRAYTEFAQDHSFQANYWRDPRPEEKENYEKFSQLARWNNEGEPFNQDYKDNYGKTKKFVWVMATQDSMVWPKEGEHWGAADSKDPYKRILPRNETDWYLNDSFGLKTAEEAGKNHYVTFEGDHLQFSMDDYTNWVKTYLSENSESSSQIE